MPVALAPPIAAAPAGHAFGENPPGRLRRVVGWVVVAVRATVGTLSFGALLAAVAAVPGGPLLALGWMLEAEGRAANGGRAKSEGEAGRTSSPPLGRLLRAAAALAGTAAAIWLVLQPLRFVAGLASDAAVIAPGSTAAGGWQAATWALAAGLAVHLGLWLLAGGRTGWFRPLRNLLRVFRSPGEALDRLGARCGWLWVELVPLRALLLGAQGLIVAAAWALLPSVLLAIQGDGAGRALVRTLGAIWLAGVLPLIPAAQANLAAARQDGFWRSLRAGLNPRAAWRTWRTRPARWVGVLLAVIVGSLPLYSLAVVEVPADARWLLTPACIVGVLPSRLLAGWTRRGVEAIAAPRRRWWTGGWLLLGWAVSLAYAGMLFLTPLVSAAGPAAALRQPGLFTPVPF
ncbi:hypothetical protein [Alienimonas californiensis]|uniref:DUF4013 domain-containing protein n=1 Tax=Alienimonas californiensis TaxID=2527989 RepID=A0A517PD68_9PLAN|nr:hypothetical protein [Alienimonas californiensis]QDT17322.1 hypothetical protein CA12_34420 [Alienimonas californiensis]